MHLPHLITDLALILCAAAVVTLIFKKIKQPVVLGYILAGFLVSSHVPFLPNLTDADSIAIWAEIGVIFLLFGLGLEFSFKKLIKVGGASTITGGVEIASMMLLGFWAGRFLGWNLLDCIFLGAIMSISSTTIVIRAFDELGVKTQKFANLVFGVLIVEDLVAVLILVVLSTVAISQQFMGWDVMMSLLNLFFFLSVWFLAGIYLIPSFLHRIQKFITDEMMLVISLALCLLMVILAVQANFSPALGAFVMGSILAETRYAEKIDHLIAPLKYLFGAIFFVSVGMLIDPDILVQYAWPIILLSLVILIGKTSSTTLGALLAGQPLKDSVKAGLSLAQIGEFSFIIATLGLTLNVTSPFLYPVAVAVSAVTTFSAPYRIRWSDQLAAAIERRLPKRWMKWLNQYSSGSASIENASHWRNLLRAYFTVLSVNSIVILALILLGLHFINPVLRPMGNTALIGNLVTLGITLGAMAPFLWALVFKKVHKLAYYQLWKDRRYNRGPLVMLEIFRIGLAVFLISILIQELFSASITVLIGTFLLIIAMMSLSRRLQQFYGRLENRFIDNLNQRENAQSRFSNELVPWDGHVVVLTVPPESRFCGPALKDLALREKYAINVATIERGNVIITLPGPDDRLFPHDKISVIGTDEQLFVFTEALQSSVDIMLNDPPNVQLHCVELTDQCPLINRTIKESGIREKTKGLVVGIERDNRRLLNPPSTMVFQVGDRVWVAGEKQMLSIFEGQGSVF